MLIEEIEQHDHGQADNQPHGEVLVKGIQKRFPRKVLYNLWLIGMQTVLFFPIPVKRPGSSEPTINY